MQKRMEVKAEYEKYILNLVLISQRLTYILNFKHMRNPIEFNGTPRA